MQSFTSMTEKEKSYDHINTCRKFNLKKKKKGKTQQTRSRVMFYRGKKSEYWMPLEMRARKLLGVMDMFTP